jgi:hypothetical protein
VISNFRRENPQTAIQAADDATTAEKTLATAEKCLVTPQALP